MLTIGESAPLFQLQALDGSLVSLAAYRGQVVLINFWSAECPWAERADLTLREWQGRVMLLSIAANAGEPFEVLRRVAGERGLALVLLDTRHEVADLYGAQTTPHCFLLDAQGRLRYQGAFDDVTFRQRVPERQYAIEAVQALLAGQPVAVPETPPYGCTIQRF
jgi:peroxiredoxin